MKIKNIYILIISFIFFITTQARSDPMEAVESVTTDSRIKVLVYDPNAIYTINLKIGFQMFIEFSSDESMETISLGDPYPWKVTPIDRRLFIKPIQPNAQTNLTVITNKRTYVFDIKSSIPDSNNDFNVIHIIRFFHPQIPQDKEKYTMEDYILYKKNKQNKQNEKIAKRIETKKTNTNNSGDKMAINLNYSFAGERNGITTPLEIFDDKYDTFIRLSNSKNPNNIKIYSVNKSGKKTILKRKNIGNFVVVPGVHLKLQITDGHYYNEVYNDLKVYSDI